VKPKLALVIPLIAVLVTGLACARQPSPGAGTQAPIQLIPTWTNTPIPAGPCANVFLPFVPGYQWIYRVDDGNDATDDASQFGLTVSSAEGSQAQVDMLEVSTGVITHTTVDCQDGAIRNYPALTLATLFGDIATGEAEVTYVDGIFMPAEADFVAAAWALDWTGDYTASGTLTVLEEGETTTGTLQESPVHVEWSLEGQEPVTVEAGSYPDAYKITRKAVVDATVLAQGMSVRATLTLNTVQWYAAGVGLLKSEVESASLSYMGISFPVQVKSRAELVEFRTGE
jgi:hypothetical protein